MCINWRMIFLATIVLGCDENNSNDHNVQNTVAKILEKAGHKVNKLPVGSNDFASASYSKSEMTGASST